MIIAAVTSPRTDNLRNVTVARAGRILPSSMSAPAHIFQVHVGDVETQGR